MMLQAWYHDKHTYEYERIRRARTLDVLCLNLPTAPGAALL